MAESAEDRDRPDTETPGTDGKTINDPLPRDGQEAPRREFEGMKPE